MNVNIHQAKTHLSKLLAEVSKGKEVIIAKSGTPIAVLSPFQKKNQTRTPGALCSQIKIAGDFDELPDDFKAYFQNNHASA